MMFQREKRMTIMRKMGKKGMRNSRKVLAKEVLLKMRTMRRRSTMRMTPNMSTLTPFLPNVGLGASRLNRMNRSPPW